METEWGYTIDLGKHQHHQRGYESAKDAWSDAKAYLNENKIALQDTPGGIPGVPYEIIVKTLKTPYGEPNDYEIRANIEPDCE